MEYRFLAENTKTENATFPYQTAMSEANVKRNKMVSTNRMGRQVEYGGQNGPIRKNSFASNYIIFLKILFQYKETLLKS